jgi:membrane protease YdiL (CAAX protease family)
MRPIRGVMPFFVLVFASTWFFQLPFLLTQRFAQLVVVGFFGPAIVAVLLSLIEGGSDGLRSLLRPLRIWRVGIVWYAIAISHAGVIGAAMTAYRVLGESRWLYPPASAQDIAAMLVIPFTEQIAWRGFAYPRLERRYGPLAASVIVGIAWALFHVQKQAFLGGGVGLRLVPIMVAFMTSGTVVYTWIYRRTGGSLLLVVVANMGAYLNNSLKALPDDATPFVLQTVGYALVAIAVALTPALRALSPSSSSDVSSSRAGAGPARGGRTEARGPASSAECRRA